MPDLSPLLAHPGANDLDYETPGLPGRRIVLRSARPRHCTPDTPILFVHHGVLRNGDDYRNHWLPLVDEAGLLVIAPEFTTEDFPRSPWYNFGNVRDTEGRQNPREAWSFGTDATVFDTLRAQGLTRRERYAMWGHSAGGQFVHRALGFGFRARVAAAITANAGTYSWPDLAIPYPYGLGAVALDENDLRRFLEFPLTIMAGTADTDTTGDTFPREPAAMAQGKTRHARAHNYIAAARARAAGLGTRCAWTIVDVHGVAHDGQRMAVVGDAILAGAPHAG